MKLIDGEDYEYDWTETPPWGDKCVDPRVTDDIDKDAFLFLPNHEFAYAGERLRLELIFRNSFAGPIALHNYLLRAGFEEINIEFVDDFEQFERNAHPLEPRTGLFTFQTLEQRLSAMPDDERWKVLFDDRMQSTDWKRVMRNLPATEAAQQGYRLWKAMVSRDQQEANWAAIRWIEMIGPATSDWARELWHSTGKEWMWCLFNPLLHALPLQEVLLLCRMKRVGKPNPTIAGDAMINLDMRFKTGVPEQDKVTKRSEMLEFLDWYDRHRKTGREREAYHRVRW